MGKVIEPHHDLDTIRKLAIDHLSRGVEKKNHPFRSFVFSTAAPNTRMVILRKVDHDPFTAWVYTDARSTKIQELKDSPEAALLFWHPSSKLQVKLIVTVKIHEKDELKKDHWSQVGSRGKDSYNTAKAPGSSVSDPDKVEYKDPFDGNDFAVLECRVEKMEVLQLRREGHIRAAFDFDEGKVKGSSFIVP